jgi:hypothetical protein
METIAARPTQTGALKGSHCPAMRSSPVEVNEAVVESEPQNNDDGRQR